MSNKSDIKLTFRPLGEADLELRTKWQNNPMVAKNLGWQIRKGTTIEEAREWFRCYVNNKNDERYIIEVDNEPVGIVGLTDINPVDKNAMLYIIIGEDNYRGQGIGRKACGHIIDYGFNKLGLHKIWLEVNSYNKPAVKLYESLGFQHEGCLKEQICLKNKYYDEIYMGLISSN